MERWLLPGHCLGCEGPVDPSSDPLVCALCRTRWRPLPPPTCRRCGAPDPPASCLVCADWPRDLGSVQSAVLLDDRTRHLIHHFKYHGWHRLAPLLAEAMLPLLAGLPPGPLVPIAMTPARRRRRGANHAELLARALGRRAGRAVWNGALLRRRESSSQTGLGALDRRANLAGAFAVTRAIPAAILVDDVFTTGATLVSAATAMLEGGSSEVAAVTFARARPPLAALAHHLTTDSSESERE